MTIAIDDVKRAAALAELAVTDAELPRLVEQMRSIVDYVEQLKSDIDATQERVVSQIENGEVP